MNSNTITREEIRETVKLLFSQALESAEIADDFNFLDCGGDSLSIMSIISDIEEKYATELDPRAVMMNPSPNGISEIVFNHLSAKKAVESIKPDLYQEAKLADDIKMTAQYTHKESESKNIFLTGTTGFLGAFLIKDLLDTDKSIHLYCHTRCSDQYDGLERIMLNMRHYGCWNNAYKKRITAIPGDLKEKRLGIDDEMWSFLTENIDAIYHNGAILNFLYPYSVLKKSNVDSTVETLKLACEGKAKYYNYVSSYSVYDNPSHFGKTVREDDPLTSADGYFLGYSETKWVSEKLIRAVGERGLKYAIYRPGDITGTKESGIWEARDLTSRIIIGCIQMRVIPVVEMKMNFTPVDFVSKAITHISRSNGASGRAYNIINPEIGSSRELLKAIFACGKFVLPIPYSLWKKQLNKTSMGTNALKILECMFDSNDAAGDIMDRHRSSQPTYDMTNTNRALRGSGIKCPPMNASLLKSYINYFKRSGII